MDENLARGAKGAELEHQLEEALPQALYITLNLLLIYSLSPLWAAGNCGMARAERSANGIREKARASGRSPTSPPTPTGAAP